MFNKSNIMTEMWRWRQIIFIGRVTRMRRNEHLPRSLTASIDSKRIRPLRMIGEDFGGDASAIMPE